MSQNRFTELQANINNVEQEVFNILQQLEDPHDSTTKQWIADLFHQHNSGETSPLLNGGLLYGITVIDNIVARLLNLDNSMVIKIKVLRRYIKNLWKQNGGPTDILNTPLIEEQEAIEIAQHIHIQQ